MTNRSPTIHANIPLIMTLHQIVQNEDYVCPEIVSPDELLGEEI